MTRLTEDVFKTVLPLCAVCPCPRVIYMYMTIIKHLLHLGFPEIKKWNFYNVRKNMYSPVVHTFYGLSYFYLLFRNAILHSCLRKDNLLILQLRPNSGAACTPVRQAPNRETSPSPILKTPCIAFIDFSRFYFISH